MLRERALKVVLVLLGLFFLAGIYPMASIVWHADQSQYGDAMMLSLYVTLGIFLLMGARNPSAHLSLIGFTAWSSFAHGAIMTVMAYKTPGDRDLLIGTAILIVMGVTLLALTPPKQSLERTSTAVA
jgi:hypothetical protein